MSWFRRIFGAGLSKVEPDEPEVVEQEQAEPNPLEGDVLGGLGLGVGELVAGIQRDEGISVEEATRGVYRAVEDGKRERKFI